METIGKQQGTSAVFFSLLQRRVLGFGFLQDGDVGVGIFPEGEKIFVTSEGASAGEVRIRSLRGSRLQGVRTSHAQMRQGSRPAVPHDSAVAEDFLELGGGSTALT